MRRLGLSLCVLGACSAAQKHSVAPARSSARQPPASDAVKPPTVAPQPAADKQDIAKSGPGEAPIGFVVFDFPKVERIPIYPLPAFGRSRAQIVASGIAHGRDLRCPWKTQVAPRRVVCGAITEVDYEILALPVSALRFLDGNPWYRVAIDGGTGWITSDTRYYELGDLLQSRMSYMTRAWDGLLYQPGEDGGWSKPLPFERETPDELIPCRVMESRWDAEEPWLRVELLSPLGEDQQVVIGDGWVPAYGEEQLQVWFWPRGL